MQPTGGRAQTTGFATPAGRGEGRGTLLAALAWTLLCLLLVGPGGCARYFRLGREDRLRGAALRDAFHLIPLHHADEVDRDRLYEAAMRAMVESLGDKYSAHLSPAHAQARAAEMEGAYTGIGVSLWPTDGFPLVVEVVEGGPAWRADIRPGDFIVSINGLDTKGRFINEVRAAAFWEAGADVHLEVLRPAGAQTLTPTLALEAIPFPKVQWEMPADGIGLITVPCFKVGTASQFADALDAWQAEGLRALILDLRDNGGGLLVETLQLCDMLLDEGLIVRTRSRHPEYQALYEPSEEVAVPSTVPIAVLVNGRSASAAEVVAGTLQANGRATIIGTRTWGKGSGTGLRHLPDGSALVLTIWRAELAGGKTIEGEGIEPDVVAGWLPPPPDRAEGQDVYGWLERNRDSRQEQLDEAVRLLQEKLSAK